MATQQDILVADVTGAQGQAVARALLEDGHNVYGLAPDPQMAQGARALGVELVPGSMDEPAAMRKAARGKDGAFLLTAAGPQAEAKQGIGAAKALAGGGIQHLVYSSVASADRQTGVPSFDAKAAVEAVLPELRCPYTIVAPAFFRESLRDPLWRDSLQQGTLALPLPGDVPVQNVEVPEVASFVAQVFARPEEYAGRRIELASDEQTGEEMAGFLSDAVGEPIRYRELPLDAVRRRDPETARLFSWLRTEGFDVDVARLRRDVPEVRWRGFQAWAGAQRWKGLLVPA